MKKLAILVLALSILATAQQPATPGKKEIKDPAEYNAYMSALNLNEPQQKAAAFEGFLQQYSSSVMKPEALAALMGAYQQLGNQAKTLDTANRLLQVDPNNVLALAMMAYNKSTGPATDAPAARQYGEHGLQALQSYTKPDGMADADFQKQKAQLTMVFNSAAGHGALMAKDYAAAQKYYRASVEANPDNLNDVYFLSLAYLEPKPIDPQGLWFIARAVALSKNNAEITKYGRSKYRRYHGEDEDGWNQLLAQVKTVGLPPAGFEIKPAATPAEQAKTIAESQDPKKMDFGTWQLIFTYADDPTAQKVWDAIKGVPLQFQARVIEASKTKLSVATTDDAIATNVADAEVEMTAPIPNTMMPKVGSDIKLQAAPSSYIKSPYMMKMSEGKFLATKPAGKKPVRRTRAHQ